MTRKHAHTDDHAEPVNEAPAEPSMPDRARAVLEHVRHQTKHNGPIAPHMVDELAAVVDHVTGDAQPAGAAE